MKKQYFFIMGDWGETIGENIRPARPNWNFYFGKIELFHQGLTVNCYEFV